VESDEVTMRNLKTIAMVCVLTGVILVSSVAVLSSSLAHAQGVSFTNAKTLTPASSKFKPACPFKKCPKTPTPVVTKTPTPTPGAHKMTSAELLAIVDETGLAHVDYQGTTYAIRDVNKGNPDATPGSTDLTGLVWPDGFNHPQEYQNFTTSIDDVVAYLNNAAGSDLLAQTWVSSDYDNNY
jgi:hypothetical protein